MNNKTSNIYPWVVVGLLWGVALLNYMDRQMLSTMRIPMMEDVRELESAANFGRLMAVFLCVYEMSSSRAEKINAFFQAADDVGVFACPSHQFFRPLEMDDVISRIRFPEFFLGVSYIDSSHSDSIA